MRHEGLSRALTERRSTVHAIRSHKETFAQRQRLKHHAPLSHDLLLLGDMLHPFPLAHIRARPQRHLVVLPSKVDKRDGEPALDLLHRDNGGMRHVLEEQSLLLGLC